MNGIKEKIIDAAFRLLELMNMCEDDEFVTEIANAVYYNDEKALEYIEEELRD